MIEFELDGKTFSVSEISQGIRQRGSDVSRALVNQMLSEKANESSVSIGLSAIDQIKKSNKLQFKYYPNFRHVSDGLCEESYNDALLAIYDKVGKFDESKSALNTWIERIIYWTFISNYRKWQSDSQNALSPSIDNEDDGIDLLNKFENSGEFIASSNWQEEALVEAYKKLSEVDKALLHYAAAGLSAAEMVEQGLISGASTNATTVALSRARKRLKTVLSESGWEI